MAKIIQFAIGLAILGFILPMFKTIMDGFTNNVTGMITTIPNVSPFEAWYWRVMPFIVPILFLVMLLIQLGRKRDDRRY